MGIDTFGVAMSCPGAWVMPQPREPNEDFQRIPLNPSFYGAWETTKEKIKLIRQMPRGTKEPICPLPRLELGGLHFGEEGF